jgi:glycosyltransferase involved in cell wall biosynthesis
MVVIPNGIDTERFFFDPISRVQLRSEWGVTNEEKLIGLVGRLDPVKDHQTFLEAAAMLIGKGLRLRVVCIGDGPADYEASLKTVAESLGLNPYITWIKSRINVSPVYSALDLLVSSAYLEGFSNVIGEAMACGVPCVVTDVGDSRLIVGDQGFVVPPKDSKSLFSAMEKSLHIKHDPSLIRKRIVDHFSANILVSHTENLLLKLLDNVGGSIRRT